MTLEIKKEGDLFKSGAEILINATNCEGVMGGGIALAFKQRFPNMFEDYVDMCEKGLIPGMLHTFVEDDNTIIINFPTKNKVSQPSNIEFIKRGIISLINTLITYRVIKGGPLTVAIPALGCGLGGLNWEEVKPMLISMCQHPLIRDDYNFIIYEPKEII